VRPFRFRAQAALDLRTREMHAAQGELARAEALRAAARGRVAAAAGALAAAHDATAERMRERDAPAHLEWYRSWMAGLAQVHAACLQSLAACDAVVRQAADACRQAQVRRESLARLRERLRDRHTAALDAEERKLLDELGARRHTAARVEPGAPGGARGS